MTFGVDQDSIEGVRRGSELRGATTLAARPAQVWFSAASYAALGYVLRKGDAIDHDHARYAVSRVFPDAGGFTALLTREGSI
jgi:hypothetical protein